MFKPENPAPAPGPLSMAQHMKAGGKFFLLLVWLLIWIGPFLLLEALKCRASTWIVKFWHQGARKISGIRVIQHGELSQGKPLLLLSNHTSYLDIPVLNSLARVNFIAKSEVKSWPGIGFLAKCCQTIFVERRAIKSREQIQHLRDCILPDKRLVLFGEGTSTDGSVILPFKSSLMEFVFDEEIAAKCRVQAVTVIAVEPEKGDKGYLPERVIYPWFDDTTLVAHFWRFFAGSGADVHVCFHPDRAVTEFSDRKDLTRWAHAYVDAGHEWLVGEGELES